MRTSRAVLSASLCMLGLLACENTTAPPATGALRVVASTSGVDLDADGYAIRVDTGVFHTLEPNGSILLEGLATGLRQVRVDSLATNCALATNAAIFSVAIVPSDTVEVALDVQCASNVGSISVLPGILGPDPDTTFLLSVDGGPAEPITRRGALLTNIPAGVHSLSLTEVASNCSPQAIAATATVHFNQTAVVNFNLSCTMRAGKIEVVTSTTGVSVDTDGYDLEVVSTGISVFGHAPSNGTLTFFNIREGERFVTLRGLKTNCSVNGPDPRLATVVFGETTVVSFDITCVPTGSVRVAAVTTGPDADALYRVVIQGGSGLNVSADLLSTGDVTIQDLGPGAFMVKLEDVAVNCDVGAATPNPKPVVVTSGATTDVSFDVTCTAASQIAFVRRGTTSLDLFTIKSSGRSLSSLNTNDVNETDPAFSPDGTRIAFQSNRYFNAEIHVMNADGTNEVRLTNHPSADWAPEWSPDGTRIAFTSNRDGNQEIYVMKADGSDVTRLTNAIEFDGEPTWSPDGSKIAFASSRSGRSQIWVMNADGSNPVRITNTTGSDFSPAWSPDGTRIAFTRQVDCGYYYYYETCQNIALVKPDGSDVAMLESSRYDAKAAWSRDSRWIAFESNLCDYYSCGSFTLSAVKRDGTRRVIIMEGEAYNPTWRP